MKNIIEKFNYILLSKQKLQICGLLVVIFIGTFVELVGITAILPFVNVIMNPDVIYSNKWLYKIYKMFQLTSPTNFLILMAVVLTVIYIVKNIYIVFMYNLQYKFTNNCQRNLAKKMMSCYMQQPYLFHVSHNSAELIRNIKDDVGGFCVTVLSVLQTLTEGAVALILMIYLFYIDKSITIGVVAIVSFALLLFGKKFKKNLNHYGELDREYNMVANKWLLQAFGGIKEISLLNKNNYFVEKRDDAYSKHVDIVRKHQLYGLLPRPFMEVLCVGGLMMVISLKLYRGVNMTYFIPTISIFAMSAFRMLPSFNRIAGYMSIILFHRAAIDNVYEDLKEVEELLKVKETTADNTVYLEFKKDISVKNLYFKYPATEEFVLQDVNLIIPKNKSIAFIGPSGMGKTTLADNILGVLKPDRGEILCDGVEIHKNISKWNDKIGYIPQTIYLLDDTIKRNIAFGIDEDDIDESRVWEALKKAQLKVFVEELDEGLETEIGEGGVRISGGQRQRLGIARALYTNPEILVLDEATSALDNETETAVMEAIDSLAGSITMIIIAHRLSTIEQCDFIYEVNNGGVSLQEK